MKNTIEVIKNYIPYNEQERVDKDVILQMAQTFDNLLDRGNLVAHFSGSAFVINKEHTKVLSSFHNIYQSWGLVGGHADGVDDLLKVAESEALEESGLEVGWGQEAGGVCSPLATGSLDSAPLTTTNWATDTICGSWRSKKGLQRGQVGLKECGGQCREGEHGSCH